MFMNYDREFPEHNKVWEALCLVYTMSCQGCFSTCRPAQRLRVENVDHTGFEMHSTLGKTNRIVATANEFGYDTKVIRDQSNTFNRIIFKKEKLDEKMA